MMDNKIEQSYVPADIRASKSENLLTVHYGIDKARSLSSSTPYNKRTHVPTKDFPTPLVFGESSPFREEEILTGNLKGKFFLGTKLHIKNDNAFDEVDWCKTGDDLSFTGQDKQSLVLPSDLTKDGLEGGHFLFPSVPHVKHIDSGFMSFCSVTDVPRLNLDNSVTAEETDQNDKKAEEQINDDLCAIFQSQPSEDEILKHLPKLDQSKNSLDVIDDYFKCKIPSFSFSDMTDLIFKSDNAKSVSEERECKHGVSEYKHVKSDCLSNSEHDSLNISVQSDISKASGHVTSSLHSDSGFISYDSISDLSKLSSNCSSFISVTDFDKKYEKTLPAFDTKSQRQKQCRCPDLDEEVKHLENKEKISRPNFDDVIKLHSPKDISNLIGRKVGVEQLDIISEFRTRNFPFIVGQILSYLNPHEIDNCFKVSKSWETVIVKDIDSNIRRLKMIIKINETKKMKGKENSKSPTKKVSNIHRSPRKKPLEDVWFNIQNSPSKSPSKRSPTKSPRKLAVSKFDIFSLEANKLKNDESLTKCPKCLLPAKVLKAERRANCLTQSCGFDYCLRCQLEYHYGKPCLITSPRKSKTSSVGSRKSKKNLRRL